MESMLYDHLGGIKVHESFTFKDGKNKGKLLKIVGTFKSPDGWMHYVKNLETNKITELSDDSLRNMRPYESIIN